MKLLKPLAALMLVVSVGAAADPVAADGPTRSARTFCTPVAAEGTGVSDPTTGTTTASIEAGPGLPVGTTIGTFTISGAPPTFDIAGPIVFTALLGQYPVGTLTITTTGTFNTATGEFTASGPVTGSSGILRGITGRLTFTGVEDPVDHTFVETVKGTLCSPARR